MVIIKNDVVSLSWIVLLVGLGFCHNANAQDEWEQIYLPVE